MTVYDVLLRFLSDMFMKIYPNQKLWFDIHINLYKHTHIFFYILFLMYCISHIETKSKKMSN